MIKNYLLDHDVMIRLNEDDEQYNGDKPVVDCNYHTWRGELAHEIQYRYRYGSLKLRDLDGNVAWIVGEISFKDYTDLVYFETLAPPTFWITRITASSVWQYKSNEDKVIYGKHWKGAQKRKPTDDDREKIKNVLASEYNSYAFKFTMDRCRKLYDTIIKITN